jgi:DNA-binding MarR family transcriptional regulator
LIVIEHDDPILRAFILFVQTARAVMKCVDAQLYRKLNLSATKFIVLQAFQHDADVSLTVSDIAEWTGTEPNNITTLIDRLEKDGLIYAKRNENDRRFTSVRITEKGRELICKAMPTAQEVVDRVMSSIGREDAVQLEKRLEVMRENAYDSLKHKTERQNV